MGYIKICSVGDKNCVLFNDYLKRISLPLKNYVLKDVKGFNKYLKEEDFCVVLDENGTNVTSQDFSKFLEQTRENVIFFVGGPEGVPNEIKGKAHKFIAFGKMTWPHKLARVMLIEQIYRAQQIMVSHPYHK